MPESEFALRTAESIAKVQNLSQNWGMCSKQCDTIPVAAHQNVLVLGDLLITATL